MSTIVIFKKNTTAYEIGKFIYSWKLIDKDLVYAIRDNSDFYGHHSLEMEIVNKGLETTMLRSNIIEMVVET